MDIRGFKKQFKTDIKIDPEFKDLLPPLHKDEYESLKKSIEEEGIRVPILVAITANENEIPKGTIIDGHNRYEIVMSSEWKDDFPVEYSDVNTRDEALLWIIDNQTGRRNLTVQEKLDIGFKRAAVLKPKAEENLKQSPGRGKKGCQKSDNLLVTIDTLQEAADYAGVSRDTASKYKKIDDSDNKEVKEKVKSGDMSINKGYQEVKNTKEWAGLTVVTIGTRKKKEYKPETPLSLKKEYKDQKKQDKELLKRIDMMIVDEMLDTFKVRLMSTKSVRNKITKTKALISKLSDWVEQLEEKKVE